MPVINLIDKAEKVYPSKTIKPAATQLTQQRVGTKATKAPEVTRSTPVNPTTAWPAPKK